MSLKITNAEGFVIGGALNQNTTQVYVRCNVDMNKQFPVEDQEGNITHVEINTIAKTTIHGGLFDEGVQIQGVSPMYWLKYSTNVTDMNDQYLEIETDLKTILEARNPDWTIEIVSIGVGL